MSEFNTKDTESSTGSTASDYKDFFLKKFSSSLKNLVEFLISTLDENSPSKKKLLKINDFLNNKHINYPKLMEK